MLFYYYEVKMISEIIDVVEKIRSESNISIKCFTEGIIDRREYLRLVKHEHPLTVEVLFKLVDRLKITIFQFSSYASLVLEDKYKDEKIFINSVIYNDSKKFDTLFESIKANENCSIYAQHAVPLAILYVSYLKNEYTLDFANLLASRIVDIKAFIRADSINDDIAASIAIYSLFYNGKNPFDIIDKCLTIIKDSSIKRFLLYPYDSFNFLFLGAINLACSLPSSDRKDEYITKICNTFFPIKKNYLQTFKDLIFLNRIMELLRKTNQRNDLITYYFVSSYIANKYSYYDSDTKFIITEEDFEIYNKVKLSYVGGEEDE